MTFFRMRASLVCVIVFCLIAPHLPAQDLVSPLYNQGLKLYSKKDFGGAVDYLGQVCDLQPTHQQARYYLVYSLLAQKQFKAAAKHAALLCTQDPNNTQYSALLAQIQQAIEANAQPKPVKKDEPTAWSPSMKVWSPSIKLASQSGTLVAMQSHAARPTNLPPSMRTLISSGSKELSGVDQILQMIDQQLYASASSQLDQMIAKDPKNPQLLHLHGMIEHQQRKFPEARGWFEKALKINPDLFNSLFLIGDCFLKEGKYAEAETTFVKLAAKKDDTFVLLNLAEAKRSLGKTDEAIGVYEKLLKADEKAVEPKIYLAETLLEKDDSEKAAEWINQALAQQPENALARFVKGKILFRGGLLDEAIVSIKQAISLSPENTAFKTLLAQIYLKGGRVPEALDTAGSVIKKDPQSWEARMVLAEGLYQMGDYPNALDHLTQAESVVQTNELILLRTRLLRKMSDLPGAVKSYQLYLSQDQSNPAVYIEYGELLEELAENSMAEDVYQEVKNRFPGTDSAFNADAKWAQVHEKVLAEKASQNAAQQPRPVPGPPNTGPNKVEY